MVMFNSEKCQLDNVNERTHTHTQFSFYSVLNLSMYLIVVLMQFKSMRHKTMATTMKMATEMMMAMWNQAIESKKRRARTQEN